MRLNYWRFAPRKDIYNYEQDPFATPGRRITIDIKTANSMYKGETEAEMLSDMARGTGCRLIYKYANDFGDKVAHTDYMVIMTPGDAQEQGLIDSPFVHNLTLVFRGGVIVNEKV
jgi:hypothetical protein